MVMTFNAETDGVDVEDVLDRLLAEVATPSRNGKP
jgi:MoxR-like ATPase